MNVKELKEVLKQLPDEVEIKMNLTGEHEVYDTINVTAETDMVNEGKLCLIVVGDPMPISTSARDFEPHPAFESDINSWIFD